MAADVNKTPNQRPERPPASGSKPKQPPKSTSKKSATNKTTQKKATSKGTSSKKPGTSAKTGTKKAPPKTTSKKTPSKTKRKLPFTRKKAPKPLRERSDTLSYVLYRRAKSKLRKKHYQGIFFLLIIFIFSLAILYFYTWDRKQRGTILDSAAAGLAALEEDQSEKAVYQFEQALSTYSQYHTFKPEWWFASDANVFPLMLRVAQGWRSLGEIEKALETFRQVAIHNTEGPDNWVGRLMVKELVDFIAPEHWFEEEQKKIYRLMLETDPTSWGTNERLLVHTTEWVGLNLFPMPTRIQKAGWIAYGLPLSGYQPDHNQFELDATMYYKVDMNPKILKIRTESLSEPEKNRLQWYVQANTECLLFGFIRQNQPSLDGIEGIVMTNKSIEAFNQAIQAWYAKEETPSPNE